MKRWKDEKGITLIEWVIIVVIIGILAAFAIPHFFSVEDDATKAQCQYNMNALAKANEIYYVDNRTYTDNTDNLKLYPGDAPSLKCPACEKLYLLNVSDDLRSYTITCPNKPSHGNVADGLSSW